MSSNHSSGMRRGPMGHGRGRGPAEKAKDFKGTMAKLIRYLGSYRINIIIAFLFSIVSVALMPTFAALTPQAPHMPSPSTALGTAV